MGYCRPLQDEPAPSCDTMSLSLSLLLALLLDALFGEPRRWHPLRGFGRAAQAIEVRWNRGSRSAGALAALGLSVLPAMLVGLLLAVLPLVLGWLCAAALAALCIGRRSLGEHVRAVAAPLAAGDLAAARQRIAWLVSRETESMNAVAVRRAAIESLLENASDAVFASLFWFAVGGLVAGPGGAAALVVCHRLINTLDAMWGYRSPRLARFGWAAARLDDGFNWLPARGTALAFALTGNSRAALACCRRQAAACASPNGGAVMSSGAGALRVALGGGAYYRGVWEPRPWLGCGAAPVDGDIPRALGLVARALVVFCLIIVCVDWLV